jgi:hypothetical protein
LLVCDVAKGPDEQTRRSYVDGLVHAEIVSEDQMDAVLADESLVIVIPLHTLQVATEIYRRIQHASHFVSIWVDGKPYPGAC